MGSGMNLRISARSESCGQQDMTNDYHGNGGEGVGGVSSALEYVLLAIGRCFIPMLHESFPDFRTCKALESTSEC